MLLDKPIGATMKGAEALAAAVAAAGVPSQVVLTNRYLDEMRAFLDRTSTFQAYGGRAAFYGDGSVPGGYFATPWRVAGGAFLDLAPHVLDAIDAVLGPIAGITATGDPNGLVLLACEHEGGRTSQCALSGNVAGERGLYLEIVGEAGRLAFDTASLDDDAWRAAFAVAQGRIVREFVAAVEAWRPHELDVRRGLYLQRLIDDAAGQLATLGGDVTR